MLNRGGILNVYQYDDEILHFAGGRLLLRGVNGSGKSTAMNMLLPFLLDGDTRRIDAAGEQTAVLKSWMLAGREDAQPIGYLWLEVDKDGEHLSFGCGIKANRASDTVTTWWFVTSRRPGVDLHLVEGRTPLSMESLRAELGADPVYRHDQRSLYRSELRNRLYGGADLEQHIRLLHIVRSPRVGDRIDVELPGHLHDALPPLSEQALQDAAQPLDELEEHRRNVAELTRTAAALDSLLEMYTEYIRGDLRRRAAEAAELAAAEARAKRESTRADAEAAAAAGEETAGRQRVEELVAGERRVRTEIEALEASPAYAEGRALEDLRAHVATLQAAVERAAAQHQDRRAVSDAAAAELDRGRRRATEDHRELLGRMGELSAAVVHAGLSADVPDIPAAAGPADVPGPDDAPARASAVVRNGLAHLRAAVNHRRGDLDEVRTELGRVDGVERQVQRAASDLEAARSDDAARRDAHTEARVRLAAATGEWRYALIAWAADHDRHRHEVGLDPGDAAPPGGPGGIPGLPHELAGGRGPVLAALGDAIAGTIDHHRRGIAGLDAARSAAADEVSQAESRLAALEAATLPTPPGQDWQRADRGTVLAEAIDFRDGVDAERRAGLEAAMEAAGLLGAELAAGGHLQSADGSLLVTAGPAVAHPLSQWLAVDAELDGSPDGEAVRRLLESISGDGNLLDGRLNAGEGSDGGDGADPVGGGADTVVTVDGRFRVGRLQGRHRKERAEHIGSSARRAALERQRAEARSVVAAARQALEATDAALTVSRRALEDAIALRARIPAGDDVARAVVAVEIAEAAAQAARGMLEARNQALQLADSLHAEAVDKARRVAANLGLPPAEEGLRQVAADLQGVEGLCGDVDARLTVWVRAEADAARAGERVRAASAAQREAAAHLAASRGQLDPMAARLATLEDSIGTAYAEVLQALQSCRADALAVATDLEAARQAVTDAAARHAAAVARADERRRAADSASHACAAALPGVRAALAVPGVLDAATDEPEVLRQPVEETPVGLRTLVQRIEGAVPAPRRPGVTADSVRQSLRQRRDALSAGWDAEDRQPDERLPLTIDVTGPAAQLPLVQAARVVTTQLGDLTSLLSSEQDAALRNLLQGLVAREVAEKLHAAGDLVARMNARLDAITTAHGIGVSLRWRRKDDLDGELTTTIDLLSRPPDLRTAGEDQRLRAALSARLDAARRDRPEAPYRDLVGDVLDYRNWFDITVMLRRPGRPVERLTRRSALSEGEKKIVCYLPLFAAVAASCDSLAEVAPEAPRFLLLDDAFAKVSEDNHPKLFGLLVELDLDFIATSERLWGTHATIPELAITEVIRDAGLGVIVLEHSRWERNAGLTPC